MPDKIIRESKQAGRPKAVNIEEVSSKYLSTKKYHHIQYVPEELKALAMEAIETYGLISMSEVYSFLPCCAQTARKFGINQDEDVLKAIRKARVAAKVEMRAYWRSPEAAAPLQLAAYKLMADENEWSRLGSSSKTTVDSKSTITIKVSFDDKPLTSDVIDAETIDITGEEE